MGSKATMKVWDVDHGLAIWLRTPNSKDIVIDLGAGSYVINELSTNENAHVVSNMTSLSINSYEINGAAKAWIPIRNDNEIIITPAVSYMLNVFLSDDSVVKKIVNYPLIPSIMENIKD